jgi:hypothetical protein
MTTDFDEAITSLRDANERFSKGALSPLAHRDERERALANALRAMATAHGIVLEEPVQVNANGEFSITSANPAGPAKFHGAGKFGDTFAAALTAHRARTGTPGPNTIASDNGWCYLNHFEAEKMVLEFADRMAGEGHKPPRERMQ